MKTAVQFGAGNIGRGFMGQLFWEAGYRTVFVDANQKLVELLNKRKAYTLRLLDAYQKQPQELTIDRFEALHVGQGAEIAEAVAHADLLCTAVGVKNLALVAPLIAAGLRQRRERGGPAADVWLCENLLGAAGILEEQVAANLDEACRGWLKESIGFVGTAVARMVPSAENRSPDDDPLLVISDAHHELPFDAGAAKTKMPEISGLRPAGNFKAEMERKLFTHNLGHASLAYLGKLKGYTYVHEGFQDPSLSAVFDGALEETAGALVRKYPHGIEAQEHARIRRDVRIRFANPMIRDTISRVGMDPVRKLGPQERLIGSAELCLSQGIFPERILTVCGAALCYDEPGDPDAVRLQRMISEHGIESVLTQVTGLESTGELGRRIMQSYLELKRA
jgi:mannitol-1-phosphate 5-dehydrogenase